MNNGHKAEESKCDGSGHVVEPIEETGWPTRVSHCPGCSACSASPKKGEEGYIVCEKCGGYTDRYEDECSRHPEAKAGEWEAKLKETGQGVEVGGEHSIYDFPDDPSRLYLDSWLCRFIRSLIAEAEQRGRLSGINEMASRGRENIKRVIGSPAVWCFEEVCKDRTCPTCKAGWKFQNDIEPAIYASLEKALKDLSQ